MSIYDFKLRKSDVASVMKEIMDEEYRQHARTCAKMTNVERLNNIQYLSGMKYMMTETLVRLEHKHA